MKAKELLNLPLINLLLPTSSDTAMKRIEELLYSSKDIRINSIYHRTIQKHFEYFFDSPESVYPKEIPHFFRIFQDGFERVYQVSQSHKYDYIYSITAIVECSLTNSTIGLKFIYTLVSQ